MNIPSHKELLRIINSKSSFVTIVKGHQCIVEILNRVIIEALPFSHKIEIERLSFKFRVDLAIALGVFNSNTRNAILDINSIRNRFAHDYRARLNAKETKTLLSSMPQNMKSYIMKREGGKPMPQSIIKGAMVLIYINLESSLENLRTGKIRAQVLNEMAEEELKKAWQGREDKLEASAAKIDEEVNKRIKKLR